MIKSVFVIFLIASSLQLVAQGNYQTGIIVTNSGDTLDGLIEYKRWDRSPGRISFKTSSESKVYAPLDIKAFMVANETYVSAIVDVDISPFKIGELDGVSQPIFSKDTVFLQSLIEGERSLLYLKDESGKNHFYIYDEGSYVSLVYKQYTIVTKTSSKALKENTAYKGVLALYLKDVPDMQRKLANTRYNTPSLTKLFEYYYEQSSSAMKYSNKRQEGRFEFGISTGASLATLNFSGTQDYLTALDFEPSINPVFGFFCNMKLLRSNGWRITNDFFYSAINFTDEKFVESIPDYTASVSFKIDYLKTAHMLQVNLLKKRSLYAAAGFATGFALAQSSQTMITYTTGTKSVQDLDPKKFDFGYVGGLGFHASRWNLEARYEYSATGLTNLVGQNSKVSRIFVFVKYRISK